MLQANSHPRQIIQEGLARRLRKPPDDAYIGDLTAVIHDVAPLLLDMLHNVDPAQELRIYWCNQTLWLDAPTGDKRLL